MKMRSGYIGILQEDGHLIHSHIRVSLGQWEWWTGNVRKIVCGK